MNAATVGYDSTTLRPTVDVALATARIDAIGLSRTLADLTERARLLEAVGRLDEAQGSAARALMVARATGDRRESARLRLLRASIALAQGRADAALRDCDSIIDEARASEWHEILADALHERGVVRYTIGALHDAIEDFDEALTLLRESSAEQGAVDRVEVALLVARDRSDRSDVTRAAAPHPLFGERNRG